MTRVYRAPDDSPEMERTREFWMERIRYVVLPEFARSPARYVEETIVQGKIDVRDQRRHGFESFEQGWKILGVCRLGGNFDHFPDGPVPVVAVPHPNRSGQILQRNDHPNKSVSLRRIVSRTKLQYHLLLGAQIQGLHVP